MSCLRMQLLHVHDAQCKCNATVISLLKPLENNETYTLEQSFTKCYPPESAMLVHKLLVLLAEERRQPL